MEKDNSPPKNEVRVTMKTRVASYLRYVYYTLEKDEGHFDHVILKAAGRAIARLVPLVELIKRRISGLHQDSKISSVMVTDKARSGEDVERRIVMLEIVLSKKELDTTASGYQTPIAASEVEEYKEVLESANEEGSQPRGGYRGGNGSTGGRYLRAGFRGGRGGRGFRGGERGGFRGSRGGFRGESRGGFRGESRGFRGGRGFRGASRGAFRDDEGYGGYPRGGYRDEEEFDDYREETTGYRGSSGYREEGTGYRGATGFRGRSARGGRGTRGGRGFRGERGGFRGERGGFRGGFRGESRGGFRGERGSNRGYRGGRGRGGFQNETTEGY